MSKGKYKIRKFSIAWYALRAVKPVSLIIVLLAIVMAFYITTEKHNDAYAIERETESVHKQITYVPVRETETKHWDVPLSDELQAHIVALCEENDIEPELVIAVIQRESNFHADTIGDNGRSYGLMQVQFWCHEQRMQRLSCTDLLDPFQNVTVGVDILREKLNKYDTVEEALTAYNAGDTGAYKYYFSKGIYANDYALKVMEIAENLQ